MTDTRPPGWYDDPGGDRDSLHWWDGGSWSGIVRGRAPYERLPDPPPADLLVADRPGTASPPGAGGRGGWVLALLAAGVVVVLVLLGGGLQGGGDPTERTLPEANPGRTYGPPTLSADPTRPPVTTPPARPVSGQIVDKDAGLVYNVLPGSWRAWDREPFRGFAAQTGYYRVVQEDAPGGVYWANVNSGPLEPALATGDLKNVAARFAAGLDINYYPDHARTGVVEKAVTVDGHKGYLIRWTAVFDPADAGGYDAKSESVTVLLVDTGKPTPSALYVSLPDQLKAEWSGVEALLASVRVLD